MVSKPGEHNEQGMSQVWGKSETHTWFWWEKSYGRLPLGWPRHRHGDT